MTDPAVILRRLEKELLLSDHKLIPETRCLSDMEVRLLTGNGCTSTDWSLVEITGETDLILIRNCRFSGRVSVHLPDGELRDASFEDTTINGPLEVISTDLVQGMTLFPGTRVVSCGILRWTSSPGCMRTRMQAGLETGEREVPLIPCMSHDEAAFLGTSEGRGSLSGMEDMLKDLSARIRGFIGKDSVIECCGVLENSLLLEGVRISSAASVRGSILYSGSQVSDGALVRDSVLQWNSRADSMALVEGSVVGECSAVERHGKLLSSFLGADSVLAEGEVTASVVGPLTGMHHQSLLIAASWPGGRGNVGYGANVGSNHTSRLPDQEIRPGTGMFFGLGVSVKFPSDFSESPFSVIATGLTTLPQKVSFPFSLITAPPDRPEGVPSGWQMLVPGWMLHSNLYSILRNLWKYSRRSKAVHTRVDKGVFTPEVRSMMKDALRRLEEASSITPEGCGKNFVTVQDRARGISAYCDCLELLELLDLIRNGDAAPEQIERFRSLAGAARNAVLESREKDLRRGTSIIDDYRLIHPAVDDDPFIAQLESFISEIGDS